MAAISAPRSPTLNDLDDSATATLRSAPDCGELAEVKFGSDRLTKQAKPPTHCLAAMSRMLLGLAPITVPQGGRKEQRLLNPLLEKIGPRSGLSTP